MLHIINLENAALCDSSKSALLANIDSTRDVVVFMNLDEGQQAITEKVLATGSTCYQLHDADIPAKLLINTITMAQLVELTETHTPIHTWY